MKLSLNIIVLIVCVVFGFPSPVFGNATDNDKEVIAFSVIGTIAVEFVIAVIAFFVWKKCKAKKNRDSSKVNSDLQGHDNRAFLPNADFSSAEQGLGNYANKEFPKSTKKVHSPSHSTSPNEKFWNSLPKVQFAGLNLARHGSYASLDNTINSQDPEIISVNLQSQDFIGLGFNISGSMRDGIFVSEVHNRGPAVESGVLKVGDRILNVTISFANMVFEDALTILSYASPYPVNICVQKHKSHVGYKANGFEMQLSHPLYRSQSLDALTRIMKESLPKRSYSELKSDNKKSFSIAKKSSFVEDTSSSRSRLYTTNDVYDEPKLEIPVCTQISEVVIHKPPTGTSVPLEKGVSFEETLFEKKIDLQESVKLREPYKLHILEKKDLPETQKSTPKPGSNGKFPLFDSDDSISKLDEQMDIHFSNCDKEFEDLKQKADEDNFDLNLELNATREPDSNSLNSESEFQALEKKIELSSNFADLFDQLTDHNKFPDLNLSFDDFTSKVAEPKEDKICEKSKNSNIFLTAERSTNQTTERHPKVVERKDNPKFVNSFNPSSSEVAAMTVQNPPDWKYPKQDVNPASKTDLILKNDEIDGLPTLPKRVKRVGDLGENCLEKLLPKPDVELKQVPPSEIKEQTTGEAAFNKNDSAEGNAEDLKAVSENKLSPLRNCEAHLQASPLTSRLFLSDSNPSAESTLNSVEKKAHETIPDILRESSPFHSDFVKPQVKLDSVDSLLSLTKNDVDSSLLESELSLNGITSSPLKPEVTTESADSSIFKYETKTQKADPSILNTETETTLIETSILLPKIGTNDDTLSKTDFANPSFFKYKLQTEETGSSKLKTDININSTDRDSFEYGVKADDIKISLLKTNELSTDKINPSILKTNSEANDTDSTTDSKDGDSNADDTSSTLLKPEMNTDVFGLAPFKAAIQSDGLPSERSELATTDNVFRVEKKILFTEPIKFHMASNKDKANAAGEKSALEISKPEVEKEIIDQNHEASSPFQTTDELKTQQRSGRLTPYKYQLKDFHLTDISLGADDSINERSDDLQDILLDDNRSEMEAEDSIRPVSVTHEESSFTQPILKPNALLPKRNLDFSKDTTSQQAEVSQNDSNDRSKSSSEESSSESESEEQKSDVRTDQNEKALFKMSLFKRIRQESLTTSSSDSEEDGTVVSKKSSPDNFLPQPLKFEPAVKNATVSTRSSESSSGRDYKPHSLSVDVDKHQRDLMDRETTPTPSLNILNNDSGEEAEIGENHEKKDEAFFEMTEDELSTDTQSLSPKSAVTRAVSCDGGFVTSDDSDLSKPRSNSLKQEIQLPGHEDNYMNWSGKRLERAESFSELPDDADRVWTGTDHTKDDKGESDSDCESNNDGVTQYDLYQPRENLTQLSHSCSSSSISSNDTKTSGERGNDSETSPEPIDLKFTLPFSESNHKTDLLCLREEDKKVVCTNYEGNGAFTATFSAHSDTDA